MFLANIHVRLVMGYLHSRQYVLGAIGGGGAAYSTRCMWGRGYLRMQITIAAVLTMNPVGERVARSR